MTSLSVRKLSRADYQRMPWKNGGGVSEQIAIAPARAAELRQQPGQTGASRIVIRHHGPSERAGAQPFLWRLSFAQVAAGGPFSLYPGYARILVVWQGHGLSLVHDGVRRPLPPLTVFAFSGDAHIASQLDAGPVTDFNVIYDPVRVQATCAIIKCDAGAHLPPTSGERFVVCVAGTLACGAHVLETGDSLRATGTDALSLVARAPGVALDVRLL